jgi:alkanesulfonate monooxygenase SsuD/methylene tetrahydromethanopterin reductase-like flavin-dependent oxidoreductase (luciferase family)
MNCSRILSTHNPDSIWIPETWGMDCCSIMATISQITKKPKIGSSILNIYSRSPALAAMSAATIDVLSNGRMILGLGTSSQAIVEDWHGTKFEHPVGRMREYVEIIRLILSGKKCNYEGNFFHLKNFNLLISTSQKKIPIYVAAINEKMVDLTWEIADGTIFYLRPLDELGKTISKMQSKRKIDVACQIITSVSDDATKAITRAKKTIAFYISVGKIYREFLTRNGFEKESNAIYEEYKKYGLKDNYIHVSDTMVNELAICGTPDDARKQLVRFANAGIDLPILQFNPVGDVQDSFDLLVSTFKDDMN